MRTSGSEDDYDGTNITTYHQINKTDNYQQLDKSIKLEKNFKKT